MIDSKIVSKGANILCILLKYNVVWTLWNTLFEMNLMYTNTVRFCPNRISYFKTKSDIGAVYFVSEIYNIVFVRFRRKLSIKYFKNIIWLSKRWKDLNLTAFNLMISSNIYTLTITNYIYLLLKFPYSVANSNLLSLF